MGSQPPPGAAYTSPSIMRILYALCLSACLLGVSVGKPFDSRYAHLLRNLHKRSAAPPSVNLRAARSAQQASYGQQSAAPAGDYGAAAAPACRTEYKQECNTVNEQECSTVNEQQCRTVQKQECNTVNEQQCNTVNEQQCNTVYDTVN